MAPEFLPLIEAPYVFADFVLHDLTRETPPDPSTYRGRLGYGTTPLPGVTRRRVRRN